MNVCDRCKKAEGVWFKVLTFHFDLFGSDKGWSMELCEPCRKAVKAFAFGGGAP